MHDHIGKIAMDKHLTRHQTDDFVCGHAAVRAANPQKLGTLLLGKQRKKIRLLGDDALSPRSVALKKRLKIFVSQRHEFLVDYFPVARAWHSSGTYFCGMSVASAPANTIPAGTGALAQTQVIGTAGCPST